MAKQFKEIEIPFGAKDSELCGWEYTIPEGMEATIVDNKIVVKKKESEDGRIKKLLIKHLEQERGSLSNDEAAEAIEWLEKQDKQKTFDYENANIQQKDFAPKNEQKPADNVELKLKPMFKTGTYVVYLNDIYMLEDDGKHYILTAIKKNTSTPVVHIPYGDEGYTMRKWTIQDAKDGDVLYCKCSGIEYIVMSKGVNEHGNIDSYFRYNTLDGFGVDVPSVLSSRQDDITPANKEQRDLLFQKMHEAGYEWDAEKKELTKIEQKAALREEEEQNFYKSVEALEDFGKFELADWLKERKNQCLKPQSTWKPSDLPHWKKSNLQNDNTTGFNSDYFCYKGYNINYKELFKKLPKED